MILCKETVRFKNFPIQMLYILMSLHTVWRKVIPAIDPVITAANDSRHMEGSYHYTGYALDVRSKNLEQVTKQEVLRELKMLLIAPQYDVVLELEGTENEHFHIEFNARQFARDTNV
jgi:hypothetical protein